MERAGPEPARGGLRVEHADHRERNRGLSRPVGCPEGAFSGRNYIGRRGEVLAAMPPERVASLITCSSPTHLPPQAIELFCVG